MDGYVSKPFVRADLEAEIERVLAAPSFTDPQEIVRLHGDGAPGVVPHVSGTPTDSPAPPSDGDAVGATLGDVSFDPARLRRVLGTDPAKMREIIQPFLDGLPSQITALKLALEGEDDDAANHFAHTLLGSAANLGFIRLAHSAERIAAALEEGAAEQIAVHIAALEEELAALDIDHLDLSS